MENFLEGQLLWGVTTWRLLLAVLLIFLGFLSRKIIGSIFKRFLLRRTADLKMEWPKDVADLLPQPLGLMVQILLWFGVALVLDLPEDPVNVVRIVWDGLTIALVVPVTWAAFRCLDVVSRVAERRSEKTETPLDDQLVPLARKTLKVTTVVILAVVVVDKLGYSATSLITSLGIGGLALALASKDTVANFFGSVIVFTDQPFHVGEWIEVGAVEGVVEEVGIRTTRIRRFDKSLATVPNQQFTQKTIVNHSRRNGRRLRTVVTLDYATTRAQMVAFVASVRELLAGTPAIDSETVSVYFQEMADVSLDVFVQGFTFSTVYADFMTTQQEVLLGIIELAETQGLKIAFSTRTVYLRSGDNEKQ